MTSSLEILEKIEAVDRTLASVSTNDYALGETLLAVQHAALLAAGEIRRLRELLRLAQPHVAGALRRIVDAQVDCSYLAAEIRGLDLKP